MSSSIPTAVRSLDRVKTTTSRPMIYLNDGPSLEQMESSRWTGEPVSFRLMMMFEDRIIAQDNVELLVRGFSVQTARRSRIYGVDALAPAGSLPFQAGQLLRFRYDIFDRKVPYLFPLF